MTGRRKKKITCVMCSCKGAAPSVFTSECSHSFHLRCIAQMGLYDGGFLCPTCGAKLTTLPDVQRFYLKPTVPAQPPKPPVPFAPYSDDQPLDAVAVVNIAAVPDHHAVGTDDAVATEAAAPGLQNVSIRAVPEHDAVAASESVPNFSVLVGLRAPPLAGPRTPIDLVMVLDVSTSMHFGSKLDLVKQAVSFVIDNLGPSDRLSVVCFSNSARRVFGLCRMTEKGKADAKLAVNNLVARGTHTNIVMGLTMGVRVLEERLHRNQVASIMFLSDGNDTNNNLNTRKPSEYLPASINKSADTKKDIFPVHAFGFGADHDPLVMHAISDFSGGTFSFIEIYDMVQDAFARCIGGLLSVVVHDLLLTLRSASHGVVIKSIPSGTHASEISGPGSRATVTVGDLYADEEKEFLIDISVPAYIHIDGDEVNENERKTPLLDITCSHKDVLSNERVEIEFVEIRRPGVPLPSEVKVKLEVDRERNRLDAAEGFAEAQRAAEAGDLKGARDILSKRRTALLASESGQAGDGVIVKIEEDMKETEERMGSKRTYEEAGRAYALSNMSAHANQRATTRRRTRSSTSKGDAYETPNMANMVNKLVKIEEE